MRDGAPSRQDRDGRRGATFSIRLTDEERERLEALRRELGGPRATGLENPIGYLQRWLGTPRDVWEPCDFGDPWTKRTAIWGDFVIPERGPFVEPKGPGPRCDVCKGKRIAPRCSVAAHRARTPRGFAEAFWRANP